MKLSAIWKPRKLEDSSIPIIITNVKWIQLSSNMKPEKKLYNFCIRLNTSYLTDSYIVFTLKMESVSKNTIFGLKMMVKSGLEKFILKSLHVGR